MRSFVCLVVAAALSLLGMPALAGQPFDAVSKTGPVAYQWAQLMRVLDTEREMLRRCEEQLCDPALERMLEIAAYSRTAPEGVIAAVNSRVNSLITQKTDEALWGKDVWWAPYWTFERLQGDCEDLVLAKYQLLRFLGFSQEDLVPVVGFSALSSGTMAHLVLAVRHEGRWLILDNMVLGIIEDRRDPYLKPFYLASVR